MNIEEFRKLQGLGSKGTSKAKDEVLAYIEYNIRAREYRLKAKVKAKSKAKAEVLAYKEYASRAREYRLQAKVAEKLNSKVKAKAKVKAKNECLAKFETNSTQVNLTVMGESCCFLRGTGYKEALGLCEGSVHEYLISLRSASKEDKLIAKVAFAKPSDILMKVSISEEFYTIRYGGNLVIRKYPIDEPESLYTFEEALDLVDSGRRKKMVAKLRGLELEFLAAVQVGLYHWENTMLLKSY